MQNNLNAQQQGIGQIMVDPCNEILYSCYVNMLVTNLNNNERFGGKPQNLLSEKGKIQKYKQYDTNFMETYIFKRLKGHILAR